MQRQPIAYEDLPPECLLRVIEFLPLADVATLLRTSGLWNSIINQNENTIYFRIASTLEPAGAPPLGSLATALKSWVSPAAKKTESWKQYCELKAEGGRMNFQSYTQQVDYKLLRTGDGLEKGKRINQAISLGPRSYRRCTVCKSTQKRCY